MSIKTVLLLLVALFVSLFMGSDCIGQKIEWLNFDFNLEKVHNGTEEIISGTVWYHKPYNVVVKTKSPTIQYMIFDSTSMLIFYPGVKTGYKYIYKNFKSLPFLDIILHTVNNRIGLSEIGYTIKKTYKSHDSLYITWEPGGKLKGILGPAQTIHVDRLLSKVELREINFKNYSQFHFDEYRKINGVDFPLSVNTETKKSGAIYYEHIMIENVSINIPIPESVLNVYPEGNIKIEVVK
ncbi:hypothetical protein HZA73_10280 [candidate division TA06 bacterium]|nr:hypothetical protein [candidate division TA06 bacterium]